MRGGIKRLALCLKPGKFPLHVAHHGDDGHALQSMSLLFPIHLPRLPEGILYACFFWFAFPELPTAHIVVDAPNSSVRAKRILLFMIVYKFIVFFLLQRLQK